jgi:mersacidin/lichenicidin family type 2 lantibiotic
MKKADIIRYWKDQDYRNNINKHEDVMFPEHPASAFTLSDNDLRSVGGAGGSTFPENARFSNTSCCHLN